MERQDRERIDSLQRTVTSLVQDRDGLTDELDKMRLRVLTLEAILGAKGVIPIEQTSAKMQAIADAVTLRFEFAPEHANFRRLRRLGQEAGAKAEEKA
jgi:hypothetical protein